MKVKIHPNSSQEKIIEGEKIYEVWVKEKAVDGNANKALLKLMKKHFKKNFKIKSGFSSRVKILEIDSVLSEAKKSTGMLDLKPAGGFNEI